MDPVDPLDPRMGSFLRVLGVNSSKMEPGDAPVQCFFDFFMTAPSRTPSFEGGTPPGDSRNGSKTYGSAWDVIEKVEKTSGDSCCGTGTLKIYQTAADAPKSM